MTQIINILDKDIQRRLEELSGICENLEDFGFETVIVLEGGRPPLLQIRSLTSKVKNRE